MADRRTSLAVRLPVTLSPRYHHGADPHPGPASCPPRLRSVRWLIGIATSDASSAPVPALKVIPRTTPQHPQRQLRRLISRWREQQATH